MNSKIIAFAIEAHNKVNHLYDDKPYSVHLAIVVGYAFRFKDVVPNTVFDDVISACWLHDTIEDCRLTYNDVKSVAGETVADIVYAVTNEKGKTRKERANDKYYEVIRDTPWATFVKLCDRLANAQYARGQGTASRMFLMYRKENSDFLESLFPDKNVYQYREMIAELKSLLNNPE